MAGKRKAPKPALCWRHQLAMFWAAWGSLLDLSGRAYPRASTKVFWRAHDCPQCGYRRF